MKKSYYFLLVVLLSSFYSYAQEHTNSFTWAKSLGGPQYESGRSIVTDNQGNIYVVGSFSGTADFMHPTEKIKSLGGGDAYISSYTPKGAFRWAKRIGGVSADEGTDLVIDSLGYLYVTGCFSDTVYFEPNQQDAMVVSQGGTDAFLAKYQSDGAFIWVKTFGSNKNDMGLSVVTNNIDVVVAGYYRDTINFTPDSIGGELVSSGGLDVFIAKFDTSGAYLWSRGIGGKKNESDIDVAIDKQGNVFATGNFKDTIDLNRGRQGVDIETLRQLYRGLYS